MIHEQKDYDINKIPEDEPVFLLRGKDPLAADLVRLWAQRNLEHDGEGLEAKRQSVLAHADRMEKYERDINYSPGC